MADSGSIGYGSYSNLSSIGGYYESNNFQSPQGYLNGEIHELIVIDGATGTDTLKIEGYLAHKWGLAGSLPSNHSHKTVSLTRGPVVTTNVTNSSSAGTYYIRPGAAASSKYSFTYADGDLVLSSLTAQTIAWDQNFSEVGVGQTVDLNASATSNLSVIYSVSDPSVAELAVTNQSSLHAWYKLDETGGVDAIDSSVYGSSAGHKGSLRNATGTPWNSGKFANAITLDGSNDHIRDYNFQGITGNARRTIALWFKTSTANKPLIQYGASGSGTLFKLSLNGSGAAVLDLGGTTLTTSTTGLANGAWHHVAATIPANGNTGGAKLYINGTVTNGSGSTAINTATTADLVIGRDGTSGSAYFNGQIDDVRLYGAELNATLISQLYGNGNGDFNRLTVKAAGTVTITATQLGNNSYAQAPSSSITATFDKSDQTIAFTPITDKSVGDFDFSPTAVASSGLDITFTSSDSQVAESPGNRPPIRRSKYGEPEPRPLPPVKVVTVPTTLPHRLPRPSPWVTSTYRPTPSPEFGSGWMLIISTEMPPQTRWQTVRQSLSGLTSRATPIMPDRERRMPNPPMPPVPSIIWEWSVSPQPRVWTSPRVMIFRL